MTNSFDVAVVGGGPAGAVTAKVLASRGLRVLILERGAVGTPVQCSGLVTPRVLDAVGLTTDAGLNVLTGAAIYSPRGRRYAIGGDRVHALAIDRGEFDRRVMDQARAVGAELRTRARVVRIERDGARIQLITDRHNQQQRFTADLVVGADGPRSIVARFLDLPKPQEFLHARGLEVHLPLMRDTQEIQIFTGKRYSQGFFAWAIPLGQRRFRIGWGTSQGGGGADHLRWLTTDYPAIFGGMAIYGQTGGLIPLGTRARTYGHGGLVVGDAAGQAKATSGGGLFMTLTAAQHAATAILNALEMGDTSATALAAYERGWRAEIGEELERAELLRRAFRQLSDAEVERGLRTLHIPGAKALVNHYGDIDYPSRLAAIMLRAVPMLRNLVQSHDAVQRLLVQRRLVDEVKMPTIGD